MTKIKRTRRKRSAAIEEKICSAQDAVRKQKVRYDKAVAKLQELISKREEIRKKELFNAMAASKRTYEEILLFIKG